MEQHAWRPATVVLVVHLEPTDFDVARGSWRRLGSVAHVCSRSIAVDKHVLLQYAVGGEFEGQAEARRESN